MPKRSVGSVNTVFDIIEELNQEDELGITDLADKLDKAPSTIHKHLSTLQSNGYVVKTGDKYKISLKFFCVGTTAKAREPLVEISAPFLKQIADESGELAWLVQEQHGYAIFLEKEEGDYAVQPYSSVGGREYLHHSAAGKAILAHLSEDQVRRICEVRGMKQLTENTITDIDELLTELNEIKSRGYSFNDGETVENHRAIASPVLYEDQVMGSIVLSGPKNRMTKDRFWEELPELVSGTANAMELELKRKLE